MSMSLQELNPQAEIVNRQDTLRVNTSAAVGLLNVLKTNLGPTGTLKLLVGGTIEQLKLTKDGLCLLKEMQIQHPTAALIARTATAQDDITGDGTTSTVLLTGELLRQATLQIELASHNLHPRCLADGLDLARDACLDLLKTDEFAIPQDNALGDRDLLLSVARTSLQTKIDAALAASMSSAVVDAIQTISSAATAANTNRAQPIDLHRVEVMAQQIGVAPACTFVKGVVLDHGPRHPDMPNYLEKVHIMTCNLSLEYEQTETSAGFVYSNAEEREKLVESERKWLDERCRTIVELKRSVCKDGETFCILNQKGVDPLSLDIFAKEGILCLRRVKRRNMERLTLACGGQPIQSLQDLSPDDLGYAGSVSVQTIGEDKFTFVQDCCPPQKKNNEATNGDETSSSTPTAQACTVHLTGPNAMIIQQMKDALRDGLRAVKNCVEDGAVTPGAGAFEIAASLQLQDVVAPTIKGKAVLGVQAFAQALLIIPKTLAANSGLDVSDCLLSLQQERRATKMAVGLDCKTGQPMLPAEEGIWDNVRVKRQSLHLATVLANQLLLVDEVMRAGKQMGNKAAAAGGAMDM